MHDEISRSTAQRIKYQTTNKPSLPHLLSAVIPNVKGGLTDAPHGNVDTSPLIHLIDFDAINCSSPAPMIFRSSFVEMIKINGNLFSPLLRNTKP
jgi:hypothetical protein